MPPNYWIADMANMDRNAKIRAAKLDPIIGKCKISESRAYHSPPWAPDLLIEGMPLTWWFRIIDLAEIMKIDPFDALIEILFFGLEGLETHYGVVDRERQWPKAELMRADSAVLAATLDGHATRMPGWTRAEKIRKRKLIQKCMKLVSEKVALMPNNREWLQQHGFLPIPPRP